jgi:uncharacterized protein
MDEVPKASRQPHAMKSLAEHFEEGLEFFNAGRFFECHEAWEEVWKRSHGNKKLFYQGLIQASVAILHAERGNLPGAVSLCERAMTKLEPLPAVYDNLALGELRDAVRNFIGYVASHEGEELPERPKLHWIARV